MHAWFLIAFIDVVLTILSGKSRVTDATIVTAQVLAFPVDAWRACTFIDVGCAFFSCKSCGAFTRVLHDAVDACCVVLALVLQAVVYVLLAVGATEAKWACAFVLVDLVATLTAVQAGVGVALVDLFLAVDTLPAWLAEAPVLVHSVGAGAMQAGVGLALIDVLSASYACISSQTVTFIGSLRVDALSVNFTGRVGPCALVYVLLALWTFESAVAFARRVAICILHLAPGILTTSFPGASIPGLTVGSHPSECTYTFVSADFIIAGSAIPAWIRGAVIDVHAAIVTSPARIALAVVASVHVRAFCFIFAGVRLAFVNIFFAVLSGKSACALA